LNFFNNSKKHSDMSVDKTTVAKIARLARINVPDERLEPLAAELNGILNWIAELDEVNTDTVQPLAGVTGHALPMRDDVVTDGDRLDDVLSNVPEGASGFFVVPKVVE
jgi:aspartyl-tRNA(Asn)/glutamyl-tRNA(Gln) amidotransferase subunit C